MTSLAIHADATPLRVDPDGSVCIGESRVLMTVLLNAYRDWGWSAEQLAEQFPTITLAEAHAVIAYYLRHYQEVDAYLNEWNAEGDRARTKWQESPEGQAIRAKLRAARLARVLT